VGSGQEAAGTPARTAGNPAKERKVLALMLSMYTKAQTLWGSFRESMRKEDGAVATEYGLLLVLVALAIVTALTFLGLAIAGKFSDACTELGGATCS
jgi:Flp pilus assembly pilin Flp